MPGLYGRGDYDLAGFAVGAVERDARAAARRPSPTATSCWGWPPRGVHSNGFSLVRHVVASSGLAWRPLPRSRRRSARRRAAGADPHLREAAASPRSPAGGGQGAGPHHRRRPDREHRRACCRTASSRRIDARRLAACRRCSRWLARAGRLDAMRAAAHLQLRDRHDRWWSTRRTPTRCAAALAAAGETRARASAASADARPAARVEFAGARGCMARRRVAVLISGGGCNLQALIDATRRAGYPAEIVLVVCNSAGRRRAWSRARRAGIADRDRRPPRFAGPRARSRRRSTTALRAAASIWSALPASCAS